MCRRGLRNNSVRRNIPLCICRSRRSSGPTNFHSRDILRGHNRIPFWRNRRNSPHTVRSPRKNLYYRRSFHIHRICEQGPQSRCFPRTDRRYSPLPRTLADSTLRSIRSHRKSHPLHRWGRCSWDTNDLQSPTFPRTVRSHSRMRRRYPDSILCTVHSFRTPRWRTDNWSDIGRTDAPRSQTPSFLYRIPDIRTPLPGHCRRNSPRIVCIHRKTQNPRTRYIGRIGRKPSRYPQRRIGSVRIPVLLRTTPPHGNRSRNSDCLSPHSSPSIYLPMRRIRSCLSGSRSNPYSGTWRPPRIPDTARIPDKSCLDSCNSSRRSRRISSPRHSRNSEAYHSRRTRLPARTERTGIYRTRGRICLPNGTRDSGVSPTLPDSPDRCPRRRSRIGDSEYPSPNTVCTDCSPRKTLCLRWWICPRDILRKGVPRNSVCNRACSTPNPRTCSWVLPNRRDRCRNLQSRPRNFCTYSKTPIARFLYPKTQIRIRSRHSPPRWALPSSFAPTSTLPRTTSRQPSTKQTFSTNVEIVPYYISLQTYYIISETQYRCIY